MTNKPWKLNSRFYAEVTPIKDTSGGVQDTCVNVKMKDYESDKVVYEIESYSTKNDAHLMKLRELLKIEAESRT